MANPTAKPSRNSIATLLSRFWHSGLSARILAIITPPVVIFSCWFIFSRIAPAADFISTGTASPLPTSGSPGPPTSTFTPQPTILLASTWTPVPSFTPSNTATWLSPTPIPPSPLRVHFVDVGQGDSILIQTPNNQAVLIDGGEAGSGIVEYLKGLSIPRIDLMIATNPQADHVGGLVQVLQAFPVDKVVTNGGISATLGYKDFLEAVAASHADYIELKRGDVISQDGLDFHCLNPLTPDNPDPNDNSLVLQFTYGTTIFLLMSDAGAQTEYDLLAAGMLSRVDILQVGQHGSADATTSAFLNTVRPTVAIYSAGLNNAGGFPDPQTIASLNAFGATVYGTDRNGTVTIISVPSGYIVNPARN